MAMTTFAKRAPWWVTCRLPTARLRRILRLLRERCARVRPSARLPQANHLRRDLGLAERDNPQGAFRQRPLF